MGNELQVFGFESKNIRILYDKGKCWINGQDSTRLLGYGNSSAAIQKHCRIEGITKRDTPTSSGIQPMTYIDEGNLYRLITRSELPNAEKFEIWIFDTVLPSIRKTGSYSITKQATPAIPKSFSEALQLAADQAKMIEKMQPKVLCYDKFLDATTTITMTVCAKLLGINPNRFFKWLREIGACYKNNSQIIRNEFLENGWFVQKMYAQEVPKDGGVEIHPRGQARVTMKGLDGLEKLAKKQGLIPQDYIVEFKDIPTTEIQNISNIDITEENLDFDDQDIDASKIDLDDVLGD